MNNKTARIVRRYRWMGTITIGAVFFLILVGGIVRSTGSGMGCPDWPKCFGQWVPPTDVSQLPADYQTIYKDHGYGSTEFNVFKTWTEYINRLIGVVIGLTVLLTLVFSFRLRKLKPSVFYLSLAAFVLVVLQGGLGAIVVRTNLEVGLISLHMLVAMLIAGVLIYAVLLSYEPVIHKKLNAVDTSAVFKVGLWIGLITLIQVMVGTQVREEVDIVALELGKAGRSNWISQLGAYYNFHKVFYYLVVGGIVYWFWRLKPFFKEYRILKTGSYVMVGIVVAEALLGISMHWFAIPPFIQPLHLLLGTSLFGIIFTINGILYVGRKKYSHAKVSTAQ